MLHHPKGVERTQPGVSTPGTPSLAAGPEGAADGTCATTKKVEGGHAKRGSISRPKAKGARSYPMNLTPIATQLLERTTETRYN